MEFEKVCWTRATTRKYTNASVKEEQLEKILAAAQNAPVAMGCHEETHITVVQNPELVKKIKSMCMLRRKNGEMVDPFYGANTLIFLSVDEVSDDFIEFCNVACIIENMILAATDCGLGSTYIWGCLKKLRMHEDFNSILGLPDGQAVLSAMAVGVSEKPLEERERRTVISVNRL